MGKTLQENKYIGAMREKYWSELTIKEKIERIREVVKRNINELNYLRDLIRKFKTHKHNAEGMPIVEEKLDNLYREQVGISLTEVEKKGEVYF
jgi:hypothetical protein